MKHYFYLLLAGFFAIVACTKESSQGETLAPCEIENFSTVCIENTNTYPVKLWINGGFQSTIAAGAEKCIAKVPAGNARIQAEQESGYLVYPDKWDFNKQAEQCKIVKAKLVL